jgi:hypothetical protein
VHIWLAAGNADGDIAMLESSRLSVSARGSSGAGDDAVRGRRQCDEQTRPKQQGTLREGDEEAWQL